MSDLFLSKKLFITGMRMRGSLGVVSPIDFRNSKIFHRSILAFKPRIPPNDQKWRFNAFRGILMSNFSSVAFGAAKSLFFHCLGQKCFIHKKFSAPKTCRLSIFGSPRPLPGQAPNAYLIYFNIMALYHYSIMFPCSK